MRDFAALKRYNDPYVADRVPYRRYLRTDPGRQWLVPYVDAIVPAAGYEDVRATVDALLASSVPDVAITVTGPWSALGDDRRAPLRDPDLDLRLIHATFEHDPRVRLTDSPAEVAQTTRGDIAHLARGDVAQTVHGDVGQTARGDVGHSARADVGDSARAEAANGTSPGVVSPFRLLLPPGWVPSRDTLERMINHLEEHDTGALCIALDETDQGVTVARLERTAALSRAQLVARPGEHLDTVLDEVFGLEWLDGESWGFTARPAVYPPRRRPIPDLDRLRAQHDKEVTRLRKRVALMQAELAQLRRDTGKGRRDAERWKEKAESWRREAVRLSRDQDRTVLKRAVRRVRNLAFPDS
jgi:hypothetical protein